MQPLLIDLNEVHYNIVDDPHRFKVVIAGRRFYKTGSIIASMALHLNTKPKNVRTGQRLPHDMGYYAPTYSQAKEVFWDRAKEQLAPLIKGKPNETDLVINFINGGRLRLYGTDQMIDKLRGRYKTKVWLDEYAFHRPGLYETVIRPMLSDTQGEAEFYTSPNGFNHAYDYFKRGQGLDPTFRSWQYPSTAGGYITEEEVLAAKRDMTLNKWRQEYMAEFVGMEGRVVIDWSFLNQDTEIQYDPDHIIYLSCDFNVDPMCWALAHRYNMGNGHIEYHYFDELAMRNTNVTKAAEEIARRYRGHRAGIRITGDASGKSRNVLQTDLGITAYPQIENALKAAGIPSHQINVEIRKANPFVGDRIDAFNALVHSGVGIIRIKINPFNCPRIAHSMEYTRYIEGSSTIWEPSLTDIKNSPDLLYDTHMFDAVSYLPYQYDPIKRDDVKPKTRLISQPYEPPRFRS